MPLNADQVKALPEEVLNELAILEDRALRAEQQLDVERSRARELRDEVAVLREVVDDSRALAEELMEHAQQLARQAADEAESVEAHLAHLLATQAR